MTSKRCKEASKHATMGAYQRSEETTWEDFKYDCPLGCDGNMVMPKKFLRGAIKIQRSSKIKYLDLCEKLALKDIEDRYEKLRDDVDKKYKESIREIDPDRADKKKTRKSSRAARVNKSLVNKPLVKLCGGYANNRSGAVAKKADRDNGHTYFGNTVKLDKKKHSGSSSDSSGSSDSSDGSDSSVDTDTDFWYDKKKKAKKTPPVKSAHIELKTFAHKKDTV